MKGTVLGGKYRLVKQLAVGGMGVVWEAEHVQIGRKLAVKLLQGQLAESPEAVTRFQREAQIAGTLGHDHICPVLDLGQTEKGQHYLVMELLRGRSLADAVHAGGVFAVDRALDITGQILDALAAAHAAGVVHRDLKPENVFLSRVGGRDDFVRVLDFGISKMSGDGGPATALTRTGIVMGTPYYMAPEQARGRRDIDARADLYATGAILYEMLTARLPYDGESVNEIIIKLATEPFVPPKTHRPDLPDAVETLVLRAMARQREDRFPTAAEMQCEVARIRSAYSSAGAPTTLSAVPPPAPTIPVDAPTISPMEKAEPTPIRPPVAAAASMPIAPTRSAPSPAEVAAHEPPSPSPAAPAASIAWHPPRNRTPLVFAAVAVVAAAVGLVIWLAATGPDEGQGETATPNLAEAPSPSPSPPAASTAPRPPLPPERESASVPPPPPRGHHLT